MGDIRELKKFTRGQIDAVLMQIGDQLGIGTAEGLNAFLRGDIVVQPLDCEVHVNRSLSPNYGILNIPVEMLEFPAMERNGPIRYTLQKKDFWDYSKTGQTLLEVYQSIRNTMHILCHLNLQDALVLKNRPLLLRRLLGENKVVYFLGSVFLSPFQDKPLMVPSLEYFFSKHTSEHIVKLNVHYLAEVGSGGHNIRVARHT